MDEHMANQIASQVRRARKSHGWTQSELADEAGVATGTVNSVENAKKVRPGNLRAVLDALHIPPLSEQPNHVDDDVQLALDLVRKWLEALPGAERPAAIQELTRFTVLGQWRVSG